MWGSLRHAAVLFTGENACCSNEDDEIGLIIVLVAQYVAICLQTCWFDAKPHGYVISHRSQNRIVSVSGKLTFLNGIRDVEMILIICSPCSYTFGNFLTRLSRKKCYHIHEALFSFLGRF